MSKTIKMDRYGRVVIPLVVRERYHLDDGPHEFEVHESGDGILLRPVAEEIAADRHASGWVVFHSEAGQQVDPVEAIDRARERRDREVRGDA